MTRKSNNFDACRLVGAFFVLVNHSMELSGHTSLGFGGMSISTLGVKIFFAISGYLIATSWIKDPNPARFIWRRARRILPALAFVVLLTVLVIGPFFTPLPLREYMVHPHSLRYLGNILFYPSYALPLVFAQNIIPNAVNGSLWTLPVEIAMYVLTPLFVFAARRHALWLILLFLTGVALNIVFYRLRPTPLVVAGTEFWSASTLVPYFVAGACIACLRLERFLDWRLGLLGVVLLNFVVPYAWPWTEAGYCAVLPYATLAIGLQSWPVVRCAGRWGDFSYGIYLWAFPMQQSAVALFGAPGGKWGNVAVALPPTLLMAVLSYHMVEKRAMAWKLRCQSERLPAVGPDVKGLVEAVPVASSQSGK
jgi:peptidoglycan/LPS O-acetylase OafA/YrhL